MLGDNSDHVGNEVVAAHHRRNIQRKTISGRVNNEGMIRAKDRGSLDSGSSRSLFQTSSQGERINSSISDNRSMDYELTKRKSGQIGTSGHTESSLLPWRRSSLGMGASEHVKAGLANNKRCSIGFGASEHVRAELPFKRSSMGWGASEHIRADLSERKELLQLPDSHDAVVGSGSELTSRRLSFGLGATEHIKAGLGASEHSHAMMPPSSRRTYDLGIGVSEHVRDIARDLERSQRVESLDGGSFSLSEHTLAFFVGSKHHRSGDESVHLRRVKRRLSGFAASFLEGLSSHHPSSGSLTGTTSFLRMSSNNDGSDDESDSDEFGTDTHEIPLETPAQRIDPAQVKSVMEAFNKAMEVSQKTQQDIHDWDRKMGLKRSHSKTMRLSSRSRKKLRSIMKKEINAIMNKV